MKETNCLVIIDVQIGFLNDETKEIPEKIQQLLENNHFDHIVGTKFVNVEDSPYVTMMNWYGLMTEDEIKLHPIIEKKCQKIIAKKAYTCFVEEFIKYLSEKGINKLYFVGIDTEGCVLKSSMDCFERGIPQEVLTNYCASTGGKECHDAGILVLKRTIGNESINEKI